MSTALSPGERVDLTALETVVREGLATFIEVGQALAEIRDRRLYRAGHGSFEEYCHEQWLLSRTRAYQLIDAAGVAEMSTNGGHAAPSNERQARELVPLKDDEQAVVEVWRDLREQHGDRLSAHRVKVEVERYLGRKLKMDCPGCGRHVLLDRIDASREMRPGTCDRCGNKISVEDTISSTYEVDSERKRQLAEKAVETFWSVVSARGEIAVVAGEPVHKLIHLERALALLTDEEVAAAISSLENGVAETKALLAELRRHRSRL
ncbi:MAG: hypothetical protein H0T69_07775 [Thermoleophilaceae bacterium]|nr:hypothetical protein [Thermoleophilaceae bacterium]